MQLHSLKNKQNVSVKDYWQAVYDLMSIHINAASPKSILEQRRSLEFENTKIQEYRINNYYPETTELFDKAINLVQEIIENSDIKHKTNSKGLTEFLNTYRKFSKGKNINLQKWFVTEVVRYSEVDPNGIMIPFPTDKKGFTASFEADNEIKSAPTVDILVIPHSRILKLSESHVKVNMGKWIYDKKTETGKDPEYKSADFFLHIYRDQYDLEIPNKEGKTDMVGYYNNILGFIPIVPIGNRFLEIDNYSFFVSNFFGAANLANIYIGQKSDEQVISTKYFPIKYEIETECKNGCLENEKGVFCVNNEICPSCKGSGVYQSISMFGTVKFPAGDDLKPGVSSINSPIGWVSPDAEVYKLSHEICNEDNDKIAAALCVNNKQNMTGQSAEAKMWDAKQKQSMYSKIVNAKIDSYELLLQYIEMIIDNKRDSTTEIIRPAVWDILTEADYINKLSENKKNNAPYQILLEDTRDLLLKKYGQNNKSLIDYVIMRDKLVVYGIDDIKNAKALFGAAITNNVIILHTHIIQVLMEISAKNPDLDFTDYKKIDALLEKEMQRYYEAETAVQQL